MSSRLSVRRKLQEREREKDAEARLTMVRSLQGQAGLMVRENLQLHLVGGVGQELGGFSECTVLHACAVNGEDVVPHMQRPTSVERRHGSVGNPSLQNETFTFSRGRAYATTITFKN